MSNGPVIGQIKKGGITTHPDAQPDQAGTPHRAAPAAVPPAGEVDPREGNKSVGGNPRKAH